jgi:hypothetical protein
MMKFWLRKTQLDFSSDCVISIFGSRTVGQMRDESENGLLMEQLAGQTLVSSVHLTRHTCYALVPATHI